MSDYIRIYEAQAVECMKCDAWEQTGLHNPRSDFAEFEYDYDQEHYTCQNCGTNCVRASTICEYRDEV